MTAWTRTLKLARLLRVPAYRRALALGVAASVEHDRTPLPDDLRTVLDAGANRGQFALVAARRWPRARLVCFEPLPGPARRLRRVLAGHHDLRVLEVALSDSAGEADMRVSRADDSSSLRAITPRQVAAFPGTEEVATLRVPTMRLDAALGAGELARPALLKIDVQGAELEVLGGASGLLGALDAVLVECSLAELYAGQALADDVIRCLHRHGFAVAAAVNPTLTRAGTVLQVDVVFRPSPPADSASRARGGR